MPLLLARRRSGDGRGGLPVLRHHHDAEHRLLRLATTTTSTPAAETPPATRAAAHRPTSPTTSPKSRIPTRRPPTARRPYLRYDDNIVTVGQTATARAAFASKASATATTTARTPSSAPASTRVRPRAVPAAVPADPTEPNDVRTNLGTRGGVPMTTMTRAAVDFGTVDPDVLMQSVVSTVLYFLVGIVVLVAGFVHGRRHSPRATCAGRCSSSAVPTPWSSPRRWTSSLALVIIVGHQGQFRPVGSGSGRHLGLRTRRRRAAGHRVGGPRGGGARALPRLHRRRRVPPRLDRGSGCPARVGGINAAALS